MATNKTKIINNAQKYIQKGNFDKAIRELQKLIEEDPRDVRTLLKIGDIYSKKGDRAEATDVYSKVAEFYGEQGFFLKAVAVYKQILKYDPKNLEVTTKLAELYEHLGLLQEAMVQYQVVATFHEEAGRQDDALSVLSKMVDLDPDNVGSRVRLAEAYSRDGKTDRAVEHFDRAANVLKKQSRVADYIKVAERLAYHDPSRLDVLKELASLYLERGDAKRAIAKLQVAFKADAEDIDTLEMLGRAFNELGQTHKTTFVNRELARLYHTKGRNEDARRVYEEILEAEPNDQDALEGLRVLQAGVRVPTLPAPAPNPLEVQAIRQPIHRSMTGEMPLMMRAEREDSAPNVQVQTKSAPFVDNPRIAVPAGAFAVTPPGGGMPAATPAPAPASRGMPAPSGAAGAAGAAGGMPAAKPSRPANVSTEVERLLTETDVYVKYGLRDKALEHLTRVAALDPDNPEAHTKMADLYVALGDPSRAAEALSQLVRIHLQAQDPVAAESIRARMRSLAPGHPMAVQGSVPPPPSRPSEMSIDIDVDSLVATGEVRRPSIDQDLMNISADLDAEEHASADGSISIDLLRLPDDEPLSSPGFGAEPQRATFAPPAQTENVDTAMVDLFRTGEVQMPDGLPTSALADDLLLKSTGGFESPFHEASAVDISEEDLVDERVSQSGLHRLSQEPGAPSPSELQDAYARAVAAEARVRRSEPIQADLVPSRIGPSDEPLEAMDVPEVEPPSLELPTFQIPPPRLSIPVDFEDPVDYSVDVRTLEEDTSEYDFIPPSRQISTDLAAEVIGEPELEENIPLAEDDAVAQISDSMDLSQLPEEPVTDSNFTLLSSELEGDDMLLGLDALDESTDVGHDPEVEEELDETDFLVEQGLYDEAREMLLDLLGRVPLYPRAVAMLDRVEEHLGLRRPNHSGDEGLGDDLGGLDEVFANAIVQDPKAPPGASRPGNGVNGQEESPPENEPPARGASSAKKSKITYL